MDLNSGGEVFGVRLVLAIAGFFGAVVSLSFVRGLTLIQIIASLIVGMASANYLTPVIVYYCGIPQAIELGAAWLVGLTAMNVIPAILRFSETNSVVAMLKARFPLMAAPVDGNSKKGE